MNYLNCEMKPIFSFFFLGGGVVKFKTLIKFAFESTILFPRLTRQGKIQQAGKKCETKICQVKFLTSYSSTLYNKGKPLNTFAAKLEPCHLNLVNSKVCLTSCLSVVWATVQTYDTNSAGYVNSFRLLKMPTLWVFQCSTLYDGMSKIYLFS